MKTVRNNTPTSAEGEPPLAREHLLWAGDVVVSTTPARLITILGSCIAVCLYDEVFQFGGMNHFLLPEGDSHLRQGPHATETLIRRMLHQGSRPNHLVAKIFGGSSPLSLPHEQFSVGLRNAQTARSVLETHGIPIAAERIGLPCGMRVVFETWSGIVWVRPHGEETV